jgi:small-conductance mechanosensitive channel
MDILANTNYIIMNAILIGAEIFLLVLLFVILNLFVRLVFKIIESLPLLSNIAERIDTIFFNIRSVLVVICFIGCLAVAGFNGYLIYIGTDLLAFNREMALQVPIEMWQKGALGLAKVIGLVILVTVGIRIIRWILRKLEQGAKDWERIKANDRSIEVFFTALYRIISNGLWLMVFAFAVWTLPYLSFLSAYIFLLLKVYLIISTGMLMVSAVAVVVDSLDALSLKYASPDNLLRFYEHLRGLIPLLRRSLEFIIYVWVATLVVMQVEFISKFAVWGPTIIQIIAIFFLARVFVVISELVVDSNLFKSPEPAQLDVQRKATILPLVKSFLRYGIFFVAFVLIIRALGINPTAILAGAGIAGIVVGLGAQPLINDLVSGFFILFENIYLVGDYIETGIARGTVEGIDIRVTRIRDPNGQLHILRNGQLNEVINFSKRYTFAVVEVGVAYDSDLNRVYKVLQQVGERLKNENPDVIEMTKVQGLENFGESELLIRTVTKVKPGCHLEVSRQLRKMIKEAFDREGIEIPFARRVVIFKNQPSL